MRSGSRPPVLFTNMHRVPSVHTPRAHQADSPEDTTPQPPQGTWGLGHICSPQEEGPFWTQWVRGTGHSAAHAQQVAGLCSQLLHGSQNMPPVVAGPETGGSGQGAGESSGRRRSRQHVWGQMPHARTSNATVRQPSSPPPRRRTGAGWHVPYQPQSRPASAWLPQGHPTAMVRENPRIPEKSCFLLGVFISHFSMCLERGRFY